MVFASQIHVVHSKPTFPIVCIIGIVLHVQYIQFSIYIYAQIYKNIYIYMYIYIYSYVYIFSQIRQGTNFAVIICCYSPLFGAIIAAICRFHCRYLPSSLPLFAVIICRYSPLLFAVIIQQYHLPLFAAIRRYFVKFKLQGMAI